MTHSPIPIAPRSRAAVGLKSLTLKGIFVAGMLFASPPVLAQTFDPDNPNEPGPLPGCAPSDVNVPQKCEPAVPAPLAAAGIPALAILGGGFIALRKRRRDSNGKK